MPANLSSLKPSILAAAQEVAESRQSKEYLNVLQIIWDFLQEYKVCTEMELNIRKYLTKLMLFL